jgi:hypothetical protein
MNKILLALLLMSCVLTTHADDTSSSLKTILAGKHRSNEHKHRDQYRHPQETLDFFDVKEDMTVVEIWPGDGWYTEILAPYLKENGKLYTAHFSADAKEPHFQKACKPLPANYTHNPIFTAMWN